MTTATSPTKTETAPKPAAAPRPSGSDEIVYQLALAICHISALNTRQPVPKDVQELALSIKTHGQTTPAIVRPHPKKKGEYEIGAGARRCVACAVAGVPTLGCVIRTLDDTAFEELILVENLQREDPDPRAEIELIDRLVKRGIHTAEQISAHLGKPEHWAIRRLQLLKVIPDLRKRWGHNGHNGINHFSVDMMSLLGGLPAETQKELAVERDYAFGECTSRKELSKYLERQVVCRLDQASFDLTDPRTFVPGCGPGCASDSSLVSSLFEFEGGKKECGRCLNTACFFKRAALARKIQFDELTKGEDLPIVCTVYRRGEDLVLGTKRVPVEDIQYKGLGRPTAKPTPGSIKVLHVGANDELTIGYLAKKRSSLGSPSKKLQPAGERLKERKQILQGKRLHLVHDDLVKALRASKRADCVEDVIDLTVIFGLPWRETTYDTEAWEQFDDRKKKGFTVHAESSFAYRFSDNKRTNFKDREEALWHGLKYVLAEVIQLVGNVGSAGRVEPDMRRVAKLISWPFRSEKERSGFENPSSAPPGGRLMFTPWNR